MNILNIEILKAEFRNIWSSLLLEISIITPLFISLIYNPHLFYIFPYKDVNIVIHEIVAIRTTSIFHSTLTFTIIICSVASAISFSKDYERGVLQTLLSLPLSRTEIFLSKILPIIVVSTIIVSISLSVTLILDFHFTMLYILKPICIGFLLALTPLTFFSSLSTFIALLTKRTLASTVISIILSYILQISPPVLSPINYYMPDKIPVFILFKMMSIKESSHGFYSGYGLPLTLLTNAPSIELLLILSLTYSICMMLVTYLYFVKGVELI